MYPLQPQQYTLLHRYDEHAVGAGALGVARHLRVAVVGGVTGGVVGDERVGGPLGEVVQVRGGDQALAGRALVGDGVLEVACVEQLVDLFSVYFPFFIYIPIMNFPKEKL